MEAIVRPYERRDRMAVRFICCETGFMGEPMERFMEGREVFADMWSGYYTDCEPEHVWVAEVDGKVVGYLLGALDTRTQEKITRKKIYPKMFLKAVTTNCIWSGKTRSYIQRVRRSNRLGELRLPDLSREYPAHLHTNILDGYRSMGLGKKIMKEWMDHLLEHGSKGLHLVTTTYNKLAVPFYKKMGFIELYEKPTTMWEGILDEPVSMLGMGMKFRL